MVQKITVLGYYDHENCGDQCYKLAFPQIFPNYTFIFTDKIRPQHLDSAAFILGGGDIAFSHLVDSLHSIKKKRKHLISVSLASSDCIDKLAGTFDIMAVRDRRSAERLSGFTAGKAWLIPDLAFSLRPDRQRGTALLKQLFKSKGRGELYSKVVLVVVNAHLCGRESGLARDEAVFHKFAYDLAYIADRTPASFVFVPFGTDDNYDDRTANAWVASKCKFYQKNLVVHDQLPPQDTLNLFAAADASICTRLHAGIFSIIGNTPFIDITHHDKCRDFFATYGMESWAADYWNFNRKTTLELLNRHLADQGSRHRLHQIDCACKQLLGEFGRQELI